MASVTRTGEVVFSKYTKLMILLLLAFLGRVFFVTYFGDVGFEPDGYLHFLFSVSSFARLPASINYAVGVWAKPLFTLLSGLVTWVTGIQSLWVIKLLNTCAWLGVGVLAYRLARQLGLSATAGSIGMLLTEFSFLGFRASIGCLTEPLFTVAVLAASVAMYAGNYRLFCLLVSLSILIRPEGLVLLPVWVAILWLIHDRRRLDDLLTMLLFPTLWNVWGFVRSGDPTFIVTSGYPIAEVGIYGHGGWLYYPMGLLQYEPLLFPLALLGFVLTARKSRYYPLHLLMVTFFGFNIVTWRFGLFGTAGLLRYFVPVIPWMAVYAASAFGFRKFIVAYRNLASRGFNFLFLQVIFTVLVLLSHTEGYNLYNTPNVHHALIDAGEWVQTKHPDDYLYSSHPALLYYAGRDFYTGAVQIGPEGIRRDGIVAFESGFGSAELSHYLARFPLLESFGDYVFLYDHNLASIEAEQIVSFREESIQSYLREGWSSPEAWGTWAVGNHSKFALHFPEPKDVTVTLAIIPHFVDGRRQSLEIYYNDTRVARYEFPIGERGVQELSFDVPKALISNQVDVIGFAYSYAVSPHDLGVSDDRRQLSVGFLEMKIAME
jgi:hypothetical protein